MSITRLFDSICKESCRLEIRNKYLLNNMSSGFPESYIKLLYYFGVCLCSVNIVFCSKAMSVGKPYLRKFPTGKSILRCSVSLLHANVCLTSKTNVANLVFASLKEGNTNLYFCSYDRFNKKNEFRVKLSVILIMKIYYMYQS